MNKMMEEIEAYRFWKWTCHSSKVSFKESLTKAGYVVYSIESDGKPNYEQSDNPFST